MGASGIGKSVMLKMLIGLIKPDAGQILFDGQDVAHMTTPAHRRAPAHRVPLPGRGALRLALRRRERRVRPARAVLEHDDEGRRSSRASSSRSISSACRASSHAPERSLGRHEEARRPRAHARPPARGHPLRRADDGARSHQHGAHQPPHRGIQRALKLTSIVVTHDMGTAFSVSDRLAMIGKGRIAPRRHQGRVSSNTTQPETVRDFIEGPRARDRRRRLAALFVLRSLRMKSHDTRTQGRALRHRASFWPWRRLPHRRDAAALVAQGRLQAPRSNDVAGLKPGAPVRMGGLDIGSGDSPSATGRSSVTGASS
jgi:phospholipid/cholesterol/gamma-HCH transport system ATP-binding protein